jgi:hypothetical protein
VDNCARTGHWTLAEDADTVTKARLAHLLGHHAERPRAGHPTLFLWTAPATLGNHDGSAVGHLVVRDCLWEGRIVWMAEAAREDRARALRTQGYQDLRPLLLSIAYGIVGSVSEAADVVQEAFLHGTATG